MSIFFSDFTEIVWRVDLVTVFFCFNSIWLRICLRYMYATVYRETLIRSCHEEQIFFFLGIFSSVFPFTVHYSVYSIVDIGEDNLKTAICCCV